MATGGELSDLSYGAFRFGRGKCIRWIKNTRVTGRRDHEEVELAFKGL